ncbi:MAG: hypothetical protein HOM11_15410 [Methylococcales bacterium]|jgi:hypothetical protein|nr:hypothetical protein [Methylococcales bacterium]MBT7444856.1 hypothetical protein [Methylococcales bacterium]
MVDEYLMKQWRVEFSHDVEIRDEFLTFEAFVAYKISVLPLAQSVALELHA